MAAIPKTEGRLRAKIYRLLGSFWTSVFRDKAQAQAIVALSRISPSISDFLSRVNNLAGLHEAGQTVQNQLVRFDLREVFETGDLTYEADTDRDYAQPAQAIYGEGSARYYALPIPGGVTPIAIQGPGRRLLVGVDFFIQADRFICFRNDPRVIFPGGSYLVLTGLNRNYRSLNQYLTNAAVTKNEDLVINYQRLQQTPRAFGLALAAVGGLSILRKGQKLLSSRTEHGRAVYLFEQTTLSVDYTHTPLVAGTTYPDNYVIGDGVQVFQDDGSGKAWWRQIDWKGGLALDPFVSAQGLSLLDRETVAYVAGSDTGSTSGSRAHARVQLSDHPSVEQAYWEETAARETASGIYLNRLLGLPDEVDHGQADQLDTYAKLTAAHVEAQELNRLLGLPAEEPDVRALPNMKLVNALDVFFQSVLGWCSFVVLLRYEHLPKPEAVLEFLRREMLTGCLPIIFAYGPTGLAESMQLGTEFQFTELVTTTPVAPQSFTLSVGLDTLFRERITLRAERPV